MTIASQQREENAVIRHLMDAGDHYIGPVKAGQTIRIVDVEGNEAADTLFFNAHDPSERYSCMDTVREQGKVYLTTGSELRSNLNNVMLTITADTVGRHDTLGGACASESTRSATTWKSGTCIPVATTGCWRSPIIRNTASTSATSPTTSTSS